MGFFAYHLSSLAMLYAMGGAGIAVLVLLKWRHDRKPKLNPELRPSEKVGFYEGRK